MLRTTFQEYVNEGIRKHKLVAEHESGKQGQYPTLGSQFEQELCDYVKKMSDLYFGMTNYELCRLAYELAFLLLDIVRAIKTFNSHVFICGV